LLPSVTTASQIADRTSRAARLELLRNAVVNSVLPDAPDDDTQQLFFAMLDRFTPTHVRLLALLSDPTGWFARHHIGEPNVTIGGKSGIIEAALPELAGRKDLIDRYAAASLRTAVATAPDDLVTVWVEGPASLSRVRDRPGPAGRGRVCRMTATTRPLPIRLR